MEAYTDNPKHGANYGLLLCYDRIVLDTIYRNQIWGDDAFSVLSGGESEHDPKDSPKSTTAMHRGDTNKESQVKKQETVRFCEKVIEASFQLSFPSNIFQVDDIKQWK